MKILVTGATGFIGNEVINLLLKTDHDIIATGIETEDVVKLNYNWYSDVKYIPKDLAEKELNYFEFFYCPDLVIHLSWAKLPNYKELFHIEENLMDNYFFLKNMVSNGLRSLSCIGTCFEYGLQEGCIDENHSPTPSTAYGLSKDTLRRFVEELKKIYEFDFKWLRLFYTYGKGQSSRSLLSQLNKAVAANEKVFNMSGGEQLRDYLPVEKLAMYIVKCSIQSEICGILNICSGKPISVRKFVEDYIKGKKLSIGLNLGYYPYPDYEPFAFWGNNKKLIKALKVYDAEHNENIEPLLSNIESMMSYYKTDESKNEKYLTKINK